MSQCIPNTIMIIKNKVKKMKTMNKSTKKVRRK
jgi:hypothetical protein